MKIFIFEVAVLLTAVPDSSFSYYEKTTHPALTQEIIRFYNYQFQEESIPDDEAKFVIQGSIDEDAGTRWLQHFYDPVYKKGLTFDAGPNKNELASIIAGLGADVSSKWMSSKEWAKATQAQAGPGGILAGITSQFFSTSDDYSWDRAIYEYAWGDANRGLRSLGHVLHLLEDATVPDHTRNDPHPPILNSGSPYEIWTKKFSPDNFELSDNLIAKDEKPVFLPNLDAYFDSIAIYSNSRFFSKDTITGAEYQTPSLNLLEKQIEKLSDGQFYTFGYSTLTDDNFRVVLIKEESRWRKPLYYIEDPDHRILSDYWSHLSKQAVLHGAGVVKLFFDEVDKEKESKVLYKKNRSLVGRWLDAVARRIFTLAGALYGISAPYDLDELEKQIGAFNPAPVPEQILAGLTGPAIKVGPDILKDRKVTAETNQQSPAAGTDIASENTLSPLEGTRGETGRTEEALSLQTLQSQNQTQETPPSPSGPSGGVTSSPAQAPPASSAPDLTPPDVSISVSQCASSLSPDGCLVATAALNINWSSSAGDLDHYVVECSKDGAACSGFNYSPTATSTQFAAADGSTYTFRAKGVDTVGNQSSFVSKIVEVNLTPVVINEIAWAGTTAATAQDEWIELYNRTAKSVSLSGWVLRSSTDDKPYLNLTGAVAAGGYYLIERTDNNTVSNVLADFIAPFGSGVGTGLVDSGEVLALQIASTTVDQTPALGTCGASMWCGGNIVERKTMERIDPDLAGGDSASWSSNDGIIRNGLSAAGANLNGTPKGRNSRNYYISQNNILSASKTLSSAKSPYFIDGNGLTVNNGVTLTINPGVVVKFYSGNPDLIVNGAIKALGTAASNVVFTSFKDDDYGGDLNGDAASTLAAAGDWRTIIINSSSQNSDINYTRLRYGGKWFAGQSVGHALLKAENSSLAVSNSIFEKSLQYGIWLVNSSSAISNSTIQNNAVDALSYGVFVDGGSPTIQNSTIANNTKGIRVENQSSPTISGNTFSGNVGEAVSVVGSTPVLSSNTASSNAINGTTFSGNISKDYTFAKDLAYVVESTLTLNPKNVFSASPGAVFKGKTTSSTIDVQGLFNVAGSGAEPVVFTSLADDGYGGDTNGDGAATGPLAGDWRSLIFELSASSSAFSYGLVRYGGAFGNGAMVIDAASVNITNSTIENNNFRGLRLSNATSTISNVVFKDHQVGGPEATGLYFDNGSHAVISNSIFQNNRIGVLSQGSTVTNGGGNTFSGNTTNTIPSGLLP